MTHSSGVWYSSSDGNVGQWKAVLNAFGAERGNQCEGSTHVWCVFGDPDAEQLPAFEHPVQGVYHFGSDYDGHEVPPGALRLCVPTIGELCADQAAAVVLYDRMVKMGGLD